VEAGVKMAQSISKAQIKEWQEKADQGDAEAQNKIGDLYYDGVAGAIEQDHAKAMEWFVKAADQGHVDGIYSVGWAYLAGEGVERDLTKGAEWMSKAVDKGHGKAMRHLARLLFMGQGVEKDTKRACELLESSASKGDIQSCCMLGKLYMEGIPNEIEKNQKKGFEYLVKAAEAGDAESMHMIAVAYEGGHGVAKDGDKAKVWRRMAEQAGFHSPDTVFRVAVAHFQGSDGVPKDHAKAAMLFKKAAEMGHGVAAGNLARFFYFGTGVQQNYVQAYEWAQRAVKLGETDAAMTVGQCCELGHGTAPDHQIALQWYFFSLNGMDSKSTRARVYFYIARCYYKGGSHDGIATQIQADYDKAHYWLQRSIDEDTISDAYNMMGDLYARGHGVKKDMKEAERLWALAAKHGNESAQEEMHAREKHTWKEHFLFWVPTILGLILLTLVLGYFVWKYKEMASESWFSKIQEIKLNDNDNFEKDDEPPRGDPSAPES